MALMKLEAFNTIDSIEAAKSTENDESVQAVFNVAINILSRDMEEKRENKESI